MAIDLDEQDGQTPLATDEKAGLSRGTWQPCELQTKESMSFCLRLSHIEIN
jgi:hypothetical protein